MNIPIVTIVGSRNIPYDKEKILYSFSLLLRTLGIIVRTGNAKGADQAARYPFEQKINQHFIENIEVYSPDDVKTNALKLITKYHPYFDNIKDEYVRKLHAHNCYQVLGKDLNKPSNLLVCYTPSGARTHSDRLADFKGTGGTGTAISIADDYNVPILNIGNPEDERVILDFIEKLTPLESSIDKHIDDKLNVYRLVGEKSTLHDFTGKLSFLHPDHFSPYYSIIATFPDKNKYQFGTIKTAIAAASFKKQSDIVELSLHSLDGDIGLTDFIIRKVDKFRMDERDEIKEYGYPYRVKWFVKERFSSPLYKTLLRLTYPIKLSYYSDDRDTYLGIDKLTGKGNDYYAKALMDYRDELILENLNNIV